MSISLYDATVTNYLQTLNATEAVLGKGKSFCEENSIELSAIVETRLIEDMNPNWFDLSKNWNLNNKTSRFGK